MIRRLSAVAVVLLLACTPLYAQNATPHNGAAVSRADLELFQSATEALRADHVEQAIAGFQKVTTDAPRFVEAYLNLGLALAQVSRNEEAAAALGRAVELKPTLRGAHLFLAISEYKLAHFEPASVAVRKETALNPGDAQAWMWQGIIDLALGRLSGSVDDLNHAASLDPKNVDILYHRGRASLALSRESYETMFQVDPHSWHVHQVLAEADTEQGRDADAVDQYQQAITAAPPQSGLYEAMGSALWRTGKFTEAESAYNTALQIDPTDTLTMYKLGCLRIDRGDATNGKPLLERVQALDPSLKLITYYLGRADAELGENEAAISSFQQVIAANVDPDITRQSYFQLARAFHRLHRETESAQAQAQYRALEQQDRQVLQQKLQERRLRADRDTSIPVSSTAESQDTQP